ncbi:MAG TPA: Ig-like domain-containing protein [Cellvibrionaceae bacterium]
MTALSSPRKNPMNRYIALLATFALLSACVADDDPGNPPPPVSNQASSSSAVTETASSVASVTQASSVSSSSDSSTEDANVSSSSSEATSSAPASLVSSSHSSNPPIASSSAPAPTVSSSSNSSSSSTPPVSSSSSSSWSSAQSSASSEPEGPQVTLTARDVHYSVSLGGSLSVNADDGVMNNDESAPGAFVEIETDPEHGSLTLNADGSFIYTPTAGAGVDYFHYRLTDGTQSVTAKVSISIHNTISSNNGFTPIEPSDDSRIIYVSSSEGVNSNDCLSPATPCATLAAGTDKMREGYPDHLYLKRGDIWRGTGLNDIPSGRSISEPAVVAFYGDSGARPRLENHGTSRLGTRRRIPETDPRWQGEGDTRRKIYLSYVHIIGLEFYNYRLDPAHPEFTGGDASASISLLDDYRHILFEDNKFNFTKINSHEYDGFDQKNLTFRRNIWNGYYANTSSYSQQISRPSNIYAGVVGLQLIENVFDHGGWHASVPGAGANMYNHNIYLQGGYDGENIIIRGNIVTRGSSHGIQMRAGGLADNNFFARNATSLSIGYKDPTMHHGVRAHVFNNVISEGHSMIKGHDACSFDNACSGAFWGIDLDTRGGNADWQARDNIVSSQAPGDTQWQTQGYGLNRIALGHKTPATGGTHHRGLDAPHITETNNIAWQWANASEGEGPSYPDPGRTLADYNTHLGGARSFEAFMTVVLNRPLQTWDERYSAAAINDYIREGFGQ